MSTIDSIKSFLAPSKFNSAIYFRPTNVLLVLRYDSKPHMTTGRFDVPPQDLDKVKELVKCQVLFDRPAAKK
jgi:hypothetical protein